MLDTSKQQVVINHKQHYITSHYILHYVTLHSVALQYIALHCAVLHRIACFCVTLHHVVSCCVALHRIASHCLATCRAVSHCVALRCITLFTVTSLCCITLHYLLQYISLHYISGQLQDTMAEGGSTGRDGTRRQLPKHNRFKLYPLNRLSVGNS